MTERRVYQPWGAAKELFSTKAPEILLDGPSGTGKTRALLTYVDALCVHYPGIRVLMLRFTRKSMTESVLPEWEDQVLGPGHPAITGEAKRPNRDSYSYPFARNVVQGKTYEGSSHVVISGLDKPGATFSSQYDFICIFESWEISFEAFELLHRANRNGHAPFQFIAMDTNPAHEGHWIRRRSLSPPLDEHTGEPRMVTLYSKHQDNPKFYDHKKRDWTALGRTYVEGTLKSLTGSRRKRLYEGVWCTESGVIYPYDPDVHLVAGQLVEKDNQKWIRVSGPDAERIGTKEGALSSVSWIPLSRFYGSIDWGYANPGSFSVWGEDPDGAFYQVAQVYKARKTIDYWAEKTLPLVQEFNIRRIAADPSRPDLIESLNDHYGPRGGRKGKRLVYGANNDFESGRNLVEQALKPLGGGAPKCYFLRDNLRYGRCEEMMLRKKPTCTIEEIVAYRWMEVRGDKPQKEAPHKEDDHAVDELRYHFQSVWGLAKPRVGSDDSEAYSPSSYGALLSSHMTKRQRKQRRVVNGLQEIGFG